MKKYTNVKSLLLVFALILAFPTVYAQNREIHTETYNPNVWSGFGKLPINTNFTLDATGTRQYYYDDNEDRVTHGTCTCRIDDFYWQKGAKASKTVNYKDGKKNGKTNQSISMPLKGGRIATYQLNGEYIDGMMVGLWTIKQNGHGVGNGHFENENRNMSFYIKDNRLTKFDITDWDNKKIQLNADEQGNVSGTYYGMNVRNNVITNEMLDKNGYGSDLSPKAKNLITKLEMGNVSIEELIENGFVLDELPVHVVSIINGALAEGLQEGEDMSLNKGFVSFGNLLELKQIPDNRFLSFEECKKILDGKQNDFNALVAVKKDMLDDYSYNGKYIKKATAQSIEDYSNDIINLKISEIVSTVEKTNSFDDLVAYYQQNKALYESLSDVKAAIDNKYEELKFKRTAEFKKGIETETDFVALINYYNNTVQPSLKHLNKKDVDDINTAFSNKKGVLEITASKRIVEEMSKKTDTKELKQYYEDLKLIIDEIKDVSSIQSAYNDMLNELMEAEAKAAKKAERKQKAKGVLKEMLNF